MTYQELLARLEELDLHDTLRSLQRAVEEDADTLVTSKFRRGLLTRRTDFKMSEAISDTRVLVVTLYETFMRDRRELTPSQILGHRPIYSVVWAVAEVVRNRILAVMNGHDQPVSLRATARAGEEPR